MCVSGPGPAYNARCVRSGLSLKMQPPGQSAPARSVIPGREHQKIIIPESSGAYYNYLLSQRMLWNRNLDAASLYLDKAIAKDPESRFLKQGLLEILVEKGNYQGALEESALLLKEDPDNVRVLLTRAAVLLQLKKWNEASAVYEKVLKTAPEESQTYFLLAETYHKANQPEKAISVYQRFIENLPNSPDVISAWFFIGRVAYNMGDYALAAQAFEETLLLKPDFEQVQLNLAEVYRELGNDEKVQAIYSKMMRDAPSNTLPYLGLGQYYLSRRELEKANEVFGKLREEHPQDPLVAKGIAHSYMNNGYFAEAAEIFSALHKQAPNDGELSYFLAYALESTGRKQEALEAYQSIPPKSSYYFQGLIYSAYLTGQTRRRHGGPGSAQGRGVRRPPGDGIRHPRLQFAATGRQQGIGGESAYGPHRRGAGQYQPALLLGRSLRQARRQRGLHRNHEAGSENRA